MSEKTTYVVLGCFRGGTSLLTGLLKLMGVPMSQTPVIYNNEDLEMQTNDVNIAIQGLLKRNNKYDVWGWKYPGSIFYMEQLLPYLQNPKFLQIYRDPYSIALTEKREVKRDINNGIQFAMLQLIHHANFFLQYNNRFPFFLVSYEKILRDKEIFLKDFLEFVNFTSEVSYEKLLEYIHPGTYEAVNK